MWVLVQIDEGKGSGVVYKDLRFYISVPCFNTLFGLFGLT